MTKEQLVKLALKKRNTKGVAMQANPFPGKNKNTDIVKPPAAEEKGESAAFEANENESSENANNGVNSQRKVKGTKPVNNTKKATMKPFWKSVKRG